MCRSQLFARLCAVGNKWNISQKGPDTEVNPADRYGPDIRLPDLREEIAQCERRQQMHEACMVCYIDLVRR